METPTDDDLSDSPHVLAVDDEVVTHGVLERLFPREGIELTICTRGADAIERLEEESFDLVLTDLTLPEMDGMDLLAHVREHHPEVSVVLISAHDNVQHAVRAMREGAVDYIPKPFSTDELVERVKTILETEQETMSEVNGARKNGHAVNGETVNGDRKNGTSHNGDHSEHANGTVLNGNSHKTNGTALSSETVEFVGEHRSIQRLKKMIPRVAQSRAPVFIHGESGTGKEILSRLIHETSNRDDEPYVAINCATLPSELVESHLFGHVEGAFTGAVDDMEGAFERADGGTLLLDEVTEVMPSVQAKLLRVLQDQEFQKVGSAKKQTVNIRVIATSNRNLKDAVQHGDFRKDLYHRLAVFPLHVPPLRSRLSDIPILAEHFVEKYTSAYGLSKKTIEPGLLQYFQTYRWPGNVRELENMIHRGIVMAADDDCITHEHVLNDFFAGEAPAGQNGNADAIMEDMAENGEIPTIAEMERKMILRTLADDDISQKQAAEKLGVSARTIRNKLQEYRDEGFSV